MNAVSTIIKPLYLAAYLVFVALAFGWLPSLSEGLPSGLLYGHLAEPLGASQKAGFGALYAALAMYYAGPRTPRGLLTLLVGCGLMLNALGPLMGSFSQFSAILVASVLVAPLVAFRKRGEQQPEGQSLENIMVAISVAGATIALLALSSRLSLFGYQQASERHFEAMIFLGLATLGGFAFGLPLAAKRCTATVPAALCALGALVGLVLLAPLESSRGLESFLRHYGGDTSEVGRLKGVALIGGRTLLLAGFAFGVLVTCLRTRASQAACFVGIAIGYVASPSLSDPTDALQLGIQVALAAALLSGLASLRTGSGLGRFATLACLPLILVAASMLPNKDVAPLAPWLRFEAETLYQSDDPLGLVAVETTAMGQPILSIDRIRMTPPIELIDADQARITASLRLLESSWKSGDPNPTVLLAGQLTIERMLAFTDWNESAGLNASLAWTTPWEHHQDAIRPLLETTWNLSPPTPFKDAQAMVGSGELDLVIVPMAFGTGISALTASAPPRSSAPFANPTWSTDQPAVVWLSSDAPIAGADLHNSVLIAGSDLNHLGIGLTHLFEDSAPSLYPPGEAVTPTLALRSLSLRATSRNLRDRSSLFNRLALASPEGGPQDLRALAALLELQVLDSPWSDPDQRFELDSELLARLAKDITGPPTAHQSLIWNHLATILVAKRGSSLNDIYQLIPGILERAGRWPELEYALAHSYLEFMMPTEAAELLGRLYAERELGLMPLVYYGDCLGQLDQWEEAALAYERARAMTPKSHSLERRLAIASLRAGRPGGEDMIRELLLEDPDDADLQAYLVPGPLPPVKKGFDPTGLDAGHHAD